MLINKGLREASSLGVGPTYSPRAAPSCPAVSTAGPFPHWACALCWEMLRSLCDPETASMRLGGCLGIYSVIPLPDARAWAWVSRKCHNFLFFSLVYWTARPRGLALAACASLCWRHWPRGHTDSKCCCEMQSINIAWFAHFTEKDDEAQSRLDQNYQANILEFYAHFPGHLPFINNTWPFLWKIQIFGPA